MASKILSYSVKSSLPDRRRPHMAESPAETFGVRGLPEEENEPSSDTQKQVGADAPVSWESNALHLLVSSGPGLPL